MSAHSRFSTNVLFSSTLLQTGVYVHLCLQKNILCDAYKVKAKLRIGLLTCFKSLSFKKIFFMLPFY